MTPPPSPKKQKDTVVNLPNQTIEINYLSTDAGFLPPTVRLANKNPAPVSKSMQTAGVTVLQQF